MRCIGGWKSSDCDQVSAKQPKLETNLCPNCGNKSAVETWQAHFAFHSKYYTRLRNAANTSPIHKGPQVGRIGTIEEAMLDGGFGKYLKSIRPAHPLDSVFKDDGVFWKVIPWVIGLWALVLLFLGIDWTLVEFTALGVIVFMVWVEIRLDNSLFRKYLKRIHLVDVQWLCLKCNHQWIETKKRPMK